MTKTFVATAERGYGDDFDYEIIYSGDDINHAKNAFTTANFDRGVITVFQNGYLIKRLERYSKSTWKVTQDLVAELTTEINVLKAEAIQKQLQLDNLLREGESNE